MSGSTIKIPKDHGSHSGKVHLSLHGFKKQSVIDIQEIVNAIDSIPDFHLEGLQDIRFDPDRELQSFLSKVFNRPHINRFQAEYITPLNCIVLYELHSKNQALHTLYHELGHHVYYCVMGSELKKEWVRNIRGSEGFVTDYAKRNASEDFAECYAYYKLNINWLSQLPNKLEFMEHKVFKNYQLKSNKFELRF